ncbi:MAG: xanthine dehydrogenase family protein molybdopterin-binding subunit [Acidimicrobiales bacterium]
MSDPSRLEDRHLLVGDTTYVANVDLPGCAFVHFVTSIEAHALITNIDVAEAANAAGVIDVVTGHDHELGAFPGSPPDYPEGTARPLLATDRVRFVGEPIVAIVAETQAQAVDAAELVVIDYEPLPAVIGFDAAAGDDTLLFESVGTNVMHRANGGVADPIDFSAFEHVVTATFINQRLAPCPLETRAAAAVWGDDGRLTQYASCQGVHPFQKGIAALYGLDLADVRVITADVGGSFGAKGRFYVEDLLLPLLAKRAGRPVRWLPSRSQDMIGLGHSRAQRQTITIGGDRYGRIHAMEAHIEVDCGAYPVAGPVLAKNAGMVMPGPMDVSNVRWTTTALVTNTTPTAAYRGAGRPEGGAMVDRAIDLYAAEAGLDPLDVRRLNLLKPDQMPWTNPTGVLYDSGDYPEALELVADYVGYEAVRHEQANRQANGDTKALGIGLSSFIDRTAGVPGTEYGSLELMPDGRMRVLTGSSPYGQGHYTTWAMLVAERTGVPLDMIDVVHGDTDIVPRGGITGGSRSAQKAGSAVAIATDMLVDEAKRAAANLLEANEVDIVLDPTSGRFAVAGSPAAATVGWAEIAALKGAASDDSDEAGYGFKCETDYEQANPTVPYGMYAAVVEVDTETGEVELRRIVTVDDAGTMIHPTIVQGQVHGGLGQAIGQALYEEFAYDAEGNPITASFLDYGIPSAAEFPSFESHLTEHPAPGNVLGAKGIAESGTIGGVPAVQNAVIDAIAYLGVKHVDLPLTPQRVWQAMQ